MLIILNLIFLLEGICANEENEAGLPFKIDFVCGVYGGKKTETNNLEFRFFLVKTW